jgi:hypothetical protein
MGTPAQVAEIRRGSLRPGGSVGTTCASAGVVHRARPRLATHTVEGIEPPFGVHREPSLKVRLAAAICPSFVVERHGLCDSPPAPTIRATGITGYVVLALLAVTAVYVATIYNNLVRLKHTVTKNWSNIDVLLKQRHDELPNLVETCKAYMKHERVAGMPSPIGEDLSAHGRRRRATSPPRA